MPKINRVFIANRGEICGRIAATAQRLGIETVAITDRSSAPAFLAAIITKFIHVKDENSALYLDGQKMVDLAKESGCDAIHPGFGFLSENPQFAELVSKSGLIWIGPSSDAITRMASKSTARSIAMDAGVPCIDGLQDFNVPDTVDGDFKDLEAFADKAGYPLLIKASMGGGGKGMRLVEEKSQLKESALRAYSEAKNSFGSGNLICERFIQTPRHIEVQILADQKGQVFAIGDRDCSIQRRHQKILEEAPAIGLSDETRKKLHDCAIKLAKTVSYTSAGTVEFLLDWSDSNRIKKDQEFFFLEMNTRLQVEHPVTEEVFGLDLVEWQFRIAEGESMPSSFEKISPRGHSIEARIYAEDIENDFFPAPGPIRGFMPATGPGIRWEVGIETVDEISAKFDPMVAKLIATGSSREVAMARLTESLRQTFFAVKASNQEFLLDICSSTEFSKQVCGTHFIKSEFESIRKIREDSRKNYETKAQSLLKKIELKRGNLQKSSSSSDSIVSVTSLTERAFSGSVKKSEPTNDLENMSIGSQGSFATPSNSSNSSESTIIGQGTFQLENGNRAAFWYSYTNTSAGEFSTVSINGRKFQRETLKRCWSGTVGSADASTEITAPVPGKVIKVSIVSGDKVEKGQTVFVLESMKMEFEVKANRDGEISSIKISEGDQVTTGESLAKWAKAED